MLEEQREAIARELDHRIRNVLSVVNSIVRLTAGNVSTVEEFEESLLGRLGALARTQSALKSGAQQSASLSDLLVAELEQYLGSDLTQLAIEGPLVPLNPRSAQALALIFHELATNSAKYGALRAPDGRITITSTVDADGDERFIVIEWREAGERLVDGPGRQGFGTGLIKQLIARSLRGDFVIAYEPNGLVCRMTLPFAEIAGR